MADIPAPGFHVTEIGPLVGQFLKIDIAIVFVAPIAVFFFF